MLRSLINLQNVETGLRTDNVSTLRLPLDFIKHPTPQNRSALYARLLAEIGQVPGVEIVSAAGSVPLNEGGSVGGTPLFVEGRSTDDGTPLPRVTTNVATGDYFRTVGMSMLAGRTFTPADDLNSAPVALVNQSLANRYWPKADVLGHRIRLSPNDPWLTVVGVVSNARQQLSADAADPVFRPLLQQPLPEARLFVRSAVPTATMARQLRTAIHRVDPQQPVETFETLDSVREGALASPRLTATLLLVFAGIALLISALGVAGVVSFSVNQRTREFGTLMAMGMDRRYVLTLVLRQGALLAVSGIVLGLAGAFVLGRVMTPMLFGVHPADPLTLAGVAAILALVTLGATLEPARRASSVDPMIALRAA
jgi:predicted permease